MILLHCELVIFTGDLLLYLLLLPHVASQGTSHTITLYTLTHTRALYNTHTHSLTHTRLPLYKEHPNVLSVLVSEACTLAA